MTRVVVDSSVAVKWFVPEIGSESAAALLDPAIQLAAPDLLHAEAGNVLWKKVERGEVTRAEAREVVKGLGRVPIAVTPSGQLVEAALEIAMVHRRTVCDCLYVALAVALDCAFVTADERLVAALAGSPLSPHVVTLASYSG